MPRKKSTPSRMIVQQQSVESIQSHELPIYFTPLTLIHSVNSEKRNFLLLRHKQTTQPTRSLYLIHHVHKNQQQSNTPLATTGLRTAIKQLSGLDINKPVCTVAGTTFHISNRPNAILQAVICDLDLEKVSKMELRTIHGVHVFFCCHWTSPFLSEQRTTWEPKSRLEPTLHVLQFSNINLPDDDTKDVIQQILSDLEHTSLRRENTEGMGMATFLVSFQDTTEELLNQCSYYQYNRSNRIVPHGVFYSSVLGRIGPSPPSCC
jgi:hypothetical protein